MSKELLIETNTIKVSPSQLTENVNKENGNLMVEGILATAEVKNGNGRYYSKELWNREMEKYKDLIEQRRSMGELDHPESTVVNLKNVSHLITDYYWDGDNVMGKIEILPTPSGNILKELIKKRSIIYSEAMYKINCENLTKNEIAKNIINIYETN